MTKEFTLRRGLAWVATFSIVDVACGHQPTSSEDATMWILLNDEIFTYTGLRRELLGHDYSSRLLQTRKSSSIFTKHCGECFGRLRGMFGRRNRKLVLARDRVGKKPLLYFSDGARLIFA